MSYFSVDVETTGLVPFVHDVTSLSVVELYSEDSFTCRLIEPENGWQWDPGTLAWARTNIPESNNKYPEFSPEVAVDGIFKLLDQYPKPWTFVGFPASMDYPFMQSVYYRTGSLQMPFHYRTFDVKSYIAGRYNVPFEADRSSINEIVGFELWLDPQIPHDPYHDALAQAQTARRALDGGIE